MLVTIIYNTDFRSEAKSLKTEVINEWSDASVNMMGIRDAINNAKYQIQLDGAVVYSGQTAVDNTTVINSIKDRL
jgi:hypothetical protein|tara:strand:- start:295 stop:519 length:225 start_codon:yes stop_codon:yes gene_type:complete